MKKFVFIALVTVMLVVFTACRSTYDYTNNVSGAFDYATVVVKDFVTLGIITVNSSEIHYSKPLGFSRGIEGSKITFAALMQEAAKLEADDIINVRIDMNTNYKTGGFFRGWTRTYNYTATALAIKYTDKLDTLESDSHLGGLHKTPETTKAVKVTRDGKAVLK